LPDLVFAISIVAFFGHKVSQISEVAVPVSRERIDSLGVRNIGGITSRSIDADFLNPRTRLEREPKGDDAAICPAHSIPGGPKVA
jgi:hypothetical protein